MYLKPFAPFFLNLPKAEHYRLEEAVSSFLNDFPRPGQPSHYTDEQIIKILELACRNPEELGYEASHWSLNLLVDAAVKEGIVDSISAKTLNQRFPELAQSMPTLTETNNRIGDVVNAIKIRRTEISYKNSDGENICEIRDYPKTEAGVRTVYVPAEFSSIMRRLRLLSGNQEYIFCQDGHNIKAMQIRKRLYLICKRAGLKKKSPHKLRKTYVSILLDNGIDKRLVQDVAGHAQIATSERNYHRNRKSDQKKEQILSDLPEFKNVKLMF